jgi:hypothetical protein
MGAPIDDLDEQLRVAKWRLMIAQRDLALLKRNKQCVNLPKLLQKLIGDAARSALAECNSMWRKESRRESRLEYTRRYRLEPNKKQRRNEQLRERRKSDPLFKMRLNIRTRIYVVFKRNGMVKTKKTFDILGCDFQVAREWLESQFSEGMTWDNIGQWHIDHKKPLALAQTEAELIELCHYKNLQPLWALDNLKKGIKH